MRKVIVSLVTALGLSAGAVQAAEPVTGVLASSAMSETVFFDIDFAGVFSGMVYAEEGVYDIGLVAVNGVLLDDLVGPGADFYEFSFDVLPGTMALTVHGSSFAGGSFFAAYEVTPAVPEAGSVAMALAGAGVIGGVAVARRRKA